MKETYKTKHPTIKEISIGDKFVLNNGEIVEFVRYDKDYNKRLTDYPFKIGLWYTSKLTFWPNDLEDEHLNIKCKIIPLKQKLDLL